MLTINIKNIALILACGFLLPSCKSKPTEYHDNVLAFGTIIEISLINVPPEQTQLVMKTIREDLKYFHFAFHPFKAGPTGRINLLLEATGEFTSNPSLIPLMKKSKLYYQQSQGLFNPAIGKLIKLWGYHQELTPQGPAPTDNEIKALIKLNPSMQTITINGVRVKNTNPAVKLDFGGIAKGYALDVIMDHLKKMGVHHASINTGGDLKVIGHGANGPWNIGIRDPRGEGVIASLITTDSEAVFTSGDYERFYIEAGKRYHHILDPRTGYPARNSQSVTVVHHDAALADAAATALFIAGPKQWLSIAKDMNIQQAMLIDRDGKIHITKALNDRIKFRKPDLEISVVSIP